MKASIIYLLFVPLFFLITGCRGDYSGWQKYEATSGGQQVIALSGQTNFTIENANGNIVISASDTAKNIYCSIIKKVKSGKSTDDAHAHLSGINIKTSKTGSGVIIKEEHPHNDGRSYNINFGILLPDNFNYNLNLGNGNITVNSSTKDLVINIGNGNADADVVPADNCNVSMSIGNGSVNLKIPGATNAAVNAKVGNGSVSSNGLSLANQHSESRILSGTLGSGAGSINLSVGNGNINLSKK